ncbi:MAG TPA: NAD(P)/FAD-dependent oxidoreductase [Luteimonas sp.]|nr:NAD(P)/FAD-dependent oxidoreductase [Luteimonas sp.]
MARPIAEPAPRADAYDCAIVGGGPAGLTAALYLLRFRRRIVLLDAGASRARWIPESHNCPGFPGGVSGREFLRRLSAQAADYGARVERARVERIERDADGFALQGEGGPWRAACVVLATGVVDVLPDAPWVEEAIAAAALRLCPICDAYEARGGALATWGPIGEAIDHACFLRTYSPRVAALALDAAAPTAAAARKAREAGIEVVAGPTRLHYDGDGCAATGADGVRRRLDALYPVMGADAQSALAVALGARVDDEGALVASAQQMTSVDGLYAIGDVVSAVNQIAVALGHAAVAATAIHNALPPERA